MAATGNERHKLAARKLRSELKLAELQAKADKLAIEAAKASGANQVEKKAEWHEAMAELATEKNKRKAARRAAKSRSGGGGSTLARAAKSAANALGLK